jgi:putative membrane protein
MNFIATTFQTLPAFLIYLAVASGLLTAFAALYLFVTPYSELALIKRGNAAAAINFSAALLGFTLPLASLVAHAVNVVDLLLWAVVAAMVQILAHFVARFLFGDFAQRIEHGNVAVATVAASISLCLGVLNATCLSY